MKRISALFALPVASVLALTPPFAEAQDPTLCKRDPTEPRCGPRWIVVMPAAAVVPAYPVPVAYPAPVAAVPVPSPPPAAPGYPVYPAVPVVPAYPAYPVYPAAPSPDPAAAVLATGMLMLGTSLMLHDLRHPGPRVRFGPRR